jgi:DNA-binding NtrC family response regulator
MSTPVAILAIGDMAFRERMRSTLLDLRWNVLEACGGADALAQLEYGTTSTVVMDNWFPDLEIREFVQEVESKFPEVDLVSTDGIFERSAKSRNSRYGELLYALRVNQQQDGRATLRGFSNDRLNKEFVRGISINSLSNVQTSTRGGRIAELLTENKRQSTVTRTGASDEAFPNSNPEVVAPATNHHLPEFIGGHPRVLEMCRRIRLVAGRDTNVLIQGPSGSGKELVAHALHRLSLRKDRPFIVVNCAAIPESLLESELFGHTKGSFTGALQSRIGRIEAASGGTLFLDEIGEMSLILQAKLLRFLESGEIQRIGDNQTQHIDARVVAASNQQLGKLSASGAFRADLFYRLAVFLIETPPLDSHMEDLPELARFFLEQTCMHSGVKKLSESAVEKLQAHTWPGNVRELAHVIERSVILAETASEITADEIEFAHIC